MLQAQKLAQSDLETEKTQNDSWLAEISGN